MKNIIYLSDKELAHVSYGGWEVLSSAAGKAALDPQGPMLSFRSDWVGRQEKIHISAWRQPGLPRTGWNPPALGRTSDLLHSACQLTCESPTVLAPNMCVPHRGSYVES